jgi:hypothetical protein
MKTFLKKSNALIFDWDWKKICFLIERHNENWNETEEKRNAMKNIFQDKFDVMSRNEIWDDQALLIMFITNY